MPIETSLVLFKPDALEKRLVGQVLARFQAAGFQIRGLKLMRLSEDLLREHYAHITHLAVFPRLISFMSSTPVVAVALEGENAISKVRELLGPTDSTAAAPGTIRGDFGEDKMVNVCHASDSTESAAVELQRFFKDGELFSF
jgi:nucleoside-diphosphate kinase